MTNHPKFTESHDSAARKSSSRTSTGSRKPFLVMCGICGCWFLDGDKIYRNAKKPEILYHEKCGDDWAVPTIWGATKEIFEGCDD